MNPAPPPAPAQRRGRLQLIAILAIFFVPMLIAGILRFADIHPAISRQKGELLEPKPDLRDARLRELGAADYPWNPVDRTWRILVPAPSACDDACTQVARDVATVWTALGRESHRVDVLWWCPDTACAWPAEVDRPQTLRLLAPDAAMRDRLPPVDAPGGLPVYVVDPNGFIVLRYRPGSDLSGLRTDLNRLLKLR